MTNTKAIAAELRRRKARQAELALRPSFVIEDFCFDEQIKFIRDKSKFKTAVCSRRAGKTVSCAADLLNTAINNDHINVLYITLNRLSAKRIIWKDILKINKEYKLEGKVNESELTVTFPNGSMLYVSGAKDATEIEKFRGMALKKVYIDESQSFRPYLQNLIDDVLVPALFDHDGQLILIGTPGPFCGGIFYESCHNPNWGNHAWTMFSNPYLEKLSGKKPEVIAEEDRARRGIGKDHPSYQREILGRWVEDLDALVFKYNSAQNNFDLLPADSDKHMEYIIGIDIGYEDSDAIAVLGYHTKLKKSYVVEEHVKNKQNISQLMEKVIELKDKYNPVKMVMDAGALGKKIQEEIRFRYNLSIDAADKHRKYEFIELLNDDLRTAKLFAKAHSYFAEDCKLVQWDKDNILKPKISTSYHSDITDAVLYAWRECKHYMSERDKLIPKIGSTLYMDELEKAEAEALTRAQSSELWDDVDDIFDPDDDPLENW
jgi:hypothetical protein